MGLAAGCGVANDEAGTDRDRNNLTPVGYDNNTNFRPLNVVDDNTVLDPDPPLNPDEGADGDGTDTDTTPGDDDTTGNDDTTTPTDNDETPNTENDTTPGVDDNTPGTDDATPDADDVTPGNDDETPGTDDGEEETGEQNDTQNPPLAGNERNFTDIPQTSIFINDIYAVRDLGIMNGVGANKFEPQRNITRAEVAAMIMKAVRKGYFQNTETNTTDTGTNNTGTAGAGQ